MYKKPKIDDNTSMLTGLPFNEAKLVDDAGDGMRGYIGLIKCARCQKERSIHPGGGNMCAICVSKL